MTMVAFLWIIYTRLFLCLRMNNCRLLVTFAISITQIGTDRTAKKIITLVVCPLSIYRQSIVLASLILKHYVREYLFWNFDKKQNNNYSPQRKTTTPNPLPPQKKSTKTFGWFCLNTECPKLLCGLGNGQRRRQTIPMWTSSREKGILQGITVCLVSAVLSTMWWPGSFQTVSRGQILVFFN